MIPYGTGLELSSSNIGIFFIMHFFGGLIIIIFSYQQTLIRNFGQHIRTIQVEENNFLQPPRTAESVNFPVVRVLLLAKTFDINFHVKFGQT